MLFSNRTAQGLHIIESNFWSEVWNKFVDKCGDDEESFIVYTTTLYSIGLYWMFGTIFLLFNFIPSLKKFRHQEEKPIDVRKMFHVRFNLFEKLKI